MEDKRRPRRPRPPMDEKMMAVSLMELRYPSLSGLSAEEIIRLTSSSSSSSSSLAKISQKKPKAAALTKLRNPSLHNLAAEEVISRPSSSCFSAKTVQKKPTEAPAATTTTTTKSSSRYPTFRFRHTSPTNKSPATSSDHHSGQNKVTKIRIKSHETNQEPSEQSENPASSLQSPLPMNSPSDLKKSCHKASDTSRRHDILEGKFVPRKRRTSCPRAQMVSSMTNHKRKSPSSSSDEEAPSKKRDDSSSLNTLLHHRDSSCPSSSNCLNGSFAIDGSNKPSLAEVRPVEPVQEPESKTESPAVHSPKTVTLSFDLNEPWIGDEKDMID